MLATVMCVYGGEPSFTSHDLYVPNEYYTELETVEVVYADSDGHFNIPFSDGSRGYCLEYMEEEASKGDVFIVADTSFAVNNQSGEDVGNLLKVYFVDYGGFTDDPVVAQHMIWHFTDDFNGWRVNESLVRDIKETASYKNIGDRGVVRFNSTHNLGYDFKVGLSPYTHHQDYWLYDYYFSLITTGGDCGGNFTNITVNNFTDIVCNYFNVTNITNNNYNFTNITVTDENISMFNITYNNISNVVNVHNDTVYNDYRNFSLLKNISYVDMRSNVTVYNNTDNSNTSYYNITNQYNQTNNTIYNYYNNTTNINNTNSNYTNHFNYTNKYTLIKHIIYYIIGSTNNNPLTDNIPTTIDTQNRINLNNYPTTNDITVIGVMVLILFIMIFISIIREKE